MKRNILLLLACAAAALPVRAREVFPLNEGWRFFFKSERTSDGARPVVLPHSWNTDPLAEGHFRETTGNYLNEIFVPAEWARKRLFVRFRGVQTVGDLFVNGRHAGQHRGGGTAFAFEITDLIRYGADNTLLMVVSNAGRSDVLPASADMNLYGGIYREAELILTGPTAVSPLYWGTDGVLVRTTAVDSLRAEGRIEVHVAAKEEHAAVLSVSLAAPDGSTVFAKRQRVRLDGKPLVVPFVVERPERWSPEHPALYTVTAAVGEGPAADSVSVRTGFRSIAATPQGGLMLDGVRRPVRGVVLYHDNALSGGTLRPADYDLDLSLVRDLGATAVRSAVMPHDRYFYDRCDELGLLVWIDLPLQRAFLGDAAYYATPQFEQNGLDQLQEIVLQHINHPSVAMWGIFAHLWSRGDDVVPYLRRLNERAHALDPSRPTVACSDQDGDLNFVTDLIVWHQSVGWTKGTTDDVRLWSDGLRRNWRHLRSAVCYGGSGCIGHAGSATQAAPRTGPMPEEHQTRFHEEYARNLHGDSLFWGTWIADMFDHGSARRPGGIDPEGLVTLDRRLCKDAYYLYRALWNPERPTLYIAERRRALRDAGRQAFRVYSSAGAPLLLVDGDTVAMVRYAPCQYRSDSVTLRGPVAVVARAGALRDSVSIRVGNVLRPKRSPVLRRTANR